MNITQPLGADQSIGALPNGAAPLNGAAFPDINALALELADVAVAFAQSLHRGDSWCKRLPLAERLQELRELFGDPRAELYILTGVHALWRWERVEEPDADSERYKQWRCANGEDDGVFVECLTRGAGEGTKGSKTWRAGNYSHGTMTYTSPPIGDLYADKALARHAEHTQRKIGGGAP